MSLEWLLKMRNEMSGPASAAASSLKKLESDLKSVNRELKQQEIAAQANPLKKQKGELELARSDLKDTMSAGGDGGLFAGIPAGDLRLEAIKKGAELATAAVKALASAVVAVASKVIEVGVAFTQAGIEAADFKEGAMLSFTTLLKNDKKAASDLLNSAVKFAGSTPFKTDEIIGGYKKLLAGGFKADGIENIMKGVGDLAALKGDSSVIDRLTGSLSRMNSAGHLTGDALREIGDVGVGRDAVLKSLSEQLKKKPAEIETMLSKGKITAAQGMAGILKAMESTTSGGKLGSLMDAKSATWSGLMSTLQSRKLELLMDLDASPAFATLKGVLKNVVDALGSDSPSGGALKSAMADLFNEMFADMKDLGGAGGKTLIAGVITKIAEGIHTVIAAIQLARPFMSAFFGVLSSAGGPAATAFGGLLRVLGAFVPGMGTAQGLAEMLGAALGYIVVGAVILTSVLAGIAGVVLAGFGSVWAAITAMLAPIFLAIEALGAMGTVVLQLGADFASVGLDAGANIVAGLVEGITSGVGAVADAARTLALSAKDAVAGALNMHSPSRVMAELGGHTAAGFAEGIGDGSSGVDKASRAMAEVPAGITGAAGAGGAGGGKSVTITVPITVNMSGDGKGAGDEIAGEIERRVRKALESILVEMGLGPEPVST